jgi:hypothetical protein
MGRRIIVPSASGHIACNIDKLEKLLGVEVVTAG